MYLVPFYVLLMTCRAITLWFAPSHLGKQKASSTVNQNFTTMSTAGLLLPSVASIGSMRSQDQNQTPFSQSQPQSRPVTEAPSPSDRSLFLPQDTVQRILGTTSTATPRSGSLRWGRSESGTLTQGQHKFSHQEALIEYHREGLAKSMESKNGDESVVDDERGKRKDSDTELERHGVGEASQTSAGPSTSTTAAPWSSSSTMTNSNNNAFDDSSSTNANEGYTVDHLMPRNTLVDENWSFDANGGGSGVAGANANASSKNFEPASETLCEGDENDKDVDIVPPGMLATGSASTPTISSSLPSSSSLPTAAAVASSSSPQQKLRVRRATFVPGDWAVSPRVLLVDDDAVIRKLSCKLLKIFGCTTDLAVDGIGAVTKMNLEKYDLVLMVV